MSRPSTKHNPLTGPVDVRIEHDGRYYRLVPVSEAARRGPWFETSETVGAAAILTPEALPAVLSEMRQSGLVVQ